VDSSLLLESRGASPLSQPLGHLTLPAEDLILLLPANRCCFMVWGGGFSTPFPFTKLFRALSCLPWGAFPGYSSQQPLPPAPGGSTPCSPRTGCGVLHCPILSQDRAWVCPSSVAPPPVSLLSRGQGQWEAWRVALGQTSSSETLEVFFPFFFFFCFPVQRFLFPRPRQGTIN
jgi:hypothetical protein